MESRGVARIAEKERKKRQPRGETRPRGEIPERAREPARYSLFELGIARGGGGDSLRDFADSAASLRFREL